MNLKKNSTIKGLNNAHANISTFDNKNIIGRVKKTVEDTNEYPQNTNYSHTETVRKIKTPKNLRDEAELRKECSRRDTALRRQELQQIEFTNGTNGNLLQNPIKHL